MYEYLVSYCEDNSTTCKHVIANINKIAQMVFNGCYIRSIHRINMDTVQRVYENISTKPKYISLYDKFGNYIESSL